MSANQSGFDNLAYTKDSQMEISEKSSPTSDSKLDVKRRNREKCLLFFLIIFLLAIVALIVAVVVVGKKDEESEMKPQPEICLTADCAKAAALLIDSMDTSVDPCEDFYSYTCGRWKQKNIIPEDRSGQSVFGLLSDDVNVILKYLLEDKDAYNEVEAIQKAKDMYASCMDMTLINTKGISVAIPLLEELGGWPVLGNDTGGQWNESDFNLVEMLTTLTSFYSQPLLSMYVSSDVKDSDNRIIYLDSPGFGLPGRLYYLTPDLEHMREAYVTFATSVAVLFGAEETSAENDMRKMLQLETDLANISMAQEDMRDNEVLYNKMKISELKENVTEPGPTDKLQFSWFPYLSGIMNLDNVNVSINQSEYVVVRDVPYFQRLFTVLQKYEKRDIANYLVWYIVRWRVGYLDTRFFDLINDYNKVVYGTQSASPRWRGCVSYVVGRMSMAVGHMFVKETFDESAKSATLDMIGNIRLAFSELLEEIDWMDSDTKSLAREKMEAMKSWIGYPDEIMEPEHLNTLYKDVIVYREEYFQTTMDIFKHSASSSLRKLREKYDKNEWTTPPSTVNAYYNSILNNIMFPAGILQPPFYSKNQPQAMNYGGIGVVIGHEITHGFDDRGRQYDKDGNLVEWWKPEIIDNFKEKAQCIVDQYGNFHVQEANLTVNGINTQGENIADNGGLKQSFRAYRKWVEMRGSEEPTLPGLNFTSNQLFFINFANLWCNNARTESMINAITNGVHSPGQFRVIGTMQNSKEFAQAFGCSNKHYMNPSNKCSVW